MQKNQGIHNLYQTNCDIGVEQTATSRTGYTLFLKQQASHSLDNVEGELVTPALKIPQRDERNISRASASLKTPVKQTYYAVGAEETL